MTPGWYADPNERFELRYHNGSSWTADVSTEGRRFLDPLGSTPSPDTGGRSARATASMVLGITAIAIGWLPYVVAAGLVCAVLALLLGIAVRRRVPASRADENAARVGITTGLIGLVVAVVGVAFTLLVARALDRYEHPAPNEAAITACRVVGDGLVQVDGTLSNLGASNADFTVRVAVVRAGTDNVQRTSRIELHDVGAGTEASFAVDMAVALDDVECRILAVDGPLPFGLDIPT